MSSVGKRRRERIRAKREAQTIHPVAELPAVPPKTRVTATPGKTARRRRQESRRKFRQDTPIKEADSRSWLTVWRDAAANLRPRSLRSRRVNRRREREHREGLDRPEERVRPRGVVWISWRWLSTAIMVSMGVILYMMVASPIFVIDTIAVGGERYLSPGEIFEASGVANRNLFSLDPQEIESRLEVNPSIADAQVFVDWPPNMVSIFITERDPALIWEQGNFGYWVDVNGIVMFPRQDQGDLLRVIYQGEEEDALGVGSTIERNIVAGALQLQAKLPRISVMLYDPIKGLGFREEGNWIAWFGVGTDMERKLSIYNSIVNQNYPTVQFAEVDVSDPDFPTYVDRFRRQ